MPRKNDRAGRGREKKFAGAAGASASVAGDEAGADAGEKFGNEITNTGGRGGDAGQLERLGMVPMNAVELDTVALDAEADRILAETADSLAGSDQAAPTGPGAIAADGSGLGGSWNDVTPGLVAAADVLLLPQWNLRTEEKTQLAEALGGVLDQLFPGGMSDPRWAPYLRLMAVSVAIGVSRRDPISGKFPPLGPMKLAEKTNATAAPAADRKAA